MCNSFKSLRISKEILASVAITKDADISWFQSTHKMTKSRIKIEEGATAAYSFTSGGGAKIFSNWSPREWHSACFVFNNETMTTFIDRDEIAKAKYGHFKVCQNYSEYLDIWQRLKECLVKAQNGIKNFNKSPSPRTLLDLSQFMHCTCTKSQP